MTISDRSPLIEKSRIRPGPLCGEPHPTEEWHRWENDDLVFYAQTCFSNKGHGGLHRCVGRMGETVEWENP